MRKFLGYGISVESDEKTGLIWLFTGEIRALVLDHKSAKALLKYLMKELEKRDID